jgi:uncharacterized membrane protein
MRRFGFFRRGALFFGPRFGVALHPLALFFLLLIVLAAIALVGYLWSRRSHHHHVVTPGARHGGGAESILRDRYARGEISTEEFNERVAALRNQ